MPDSGEGFIATAQSATAKVSFSRQLSGIRVATAGSERPIGASQSAGRGESEGSRASPLAVVPLRRVTTEPSRKGVHRRALAGTATEGVTVVRSGQLIGADIGGAVPRPFTTRLGGEAVLAFHEDGHHCRGGCACQSPSVGGARPDQAVARFGAVDSV